MELWNYGTTELPGTTEPPTWIHLPVTSQPRNLIDDQWSLLKKCFFLNVLPEKSIFPYNLFIKTDHVDAI